MKIRINPAHLTESPYTYIASKDNKEDFFRFDEIALESLADEILNSQPTSLMISGFRGAGKTSFIEKLEESLANKSSNEKRQTVFVKLNFSKYEEHKFVIRKLIRNLYLSIEGNGHLQTLAQRDSSLKVLLDSMYKKTYLNVEAQLNIKNEKSTSHETKIEKSVTIGSVADPLVAAIGSAALFTGIESWGKYITGGLLAAYSIFKGISVAKNFTKQETNSALVEKIETTIYDDEIADYLFRDLLQKLEQYFRLVFVLDELDKIQDGEQINKVVNELKPFLLSGLCNFVLVSGQDLYYRYFNSVFQNDPVLASIFSRTHHISLPYNMHSRVEQFVSNHSKAKEDANLFYDLQQSLIFDSNRLPRKLVASIRQLISQAKWIKEESIFELDISTADSSRYELKRKLEEAIDDMIKSLETDFSITDNPPIKDLFIGQFYIWCNRLLLLEEGTEYKKFDLLDNVEPWETQLERLSKKRAVFLEVFLKTLNEIGCCTYNSANDTFAISWSGNKSKAIEKSTPKKEESRKETKTTAISKEKKIGKKAIRSTRKIAEKKIETLEKNQETDVEEKTKKAIEQPVKDKGVDDLEIAFERLVQTAIEIINYYKSIHNMEGFIKNEFLVKVVIIDELRNLHPVFEEFFETSRISEFVHEIEDSINKTSASISDSIEIDSSLIKLNRLSEDLNNLFITLIFDISPEINGFVSHTDKSLELDNQRIPNLDLFFHNIEERPSIGFKVMTIDVIKDLDTNLLYDSVDFLGRVNKITGKENNVIIVLFANQLSLGEVELQKRAKETLAKMAPDLIHNIELKLLVDEPYYDLYKKIREVVHEEKTVFNERLLDKILFFDGTEINFTSSEHGQYLSLRKNRGTEVSLDITLPRRECLHVKVFRKRNEKSILKLVLDNPRAQETNLKYDNLVLSHFDMDNNHTKPWRLKNEPSCYAIQPSSSESIEDWVMEDYNIYKAYENSFWKNDDSMFVSLSHFRIEGDTDIAYILLYYDFEDKTYEGLDIFDPGGI